MTRFSLPPGTVSQVHARRVVVVAPHFDDEVLGCGGLLRQLIRAGATIRVLFLSDGSGGVEDIEDRPQYAARRSKEAAVVADRLGVASFEELGLPDGSLIDHLGAIAEFVAAELADFRPDLLLTPSPTEITTDHRAAFLALHRVLAPLRPGDALHQVAAPMRVLLYEVNRLLHPNLLVAVGDELSEVAALAGLYRSQTERHDYVPAAIGLRRYRTLSLPAGVGAAEAYRSLSLDDFVTRSAVALTEHLGGIVDARRSCHGPLVSVVVRTRDRPAKLAEALASLESGTYRDVEVIVINDGDAAPEAAESFSFPLVHHDTGEASGPAAAAQCGLDAATGEFVCFLDDDDLFFPEHLARLVERAEETACPVVYSDAAVAVYERDGDGAWRCIERRLPYSRDFDATRLLVDNYIPFNTVLVRRELADRVGPFDESLPFFEDWDFLIRLAIHTGFEHLRATTCEYRHFRDDPSHLFGSDPEQRSDFLDGRARIYEKHADRLGPSQLARAISGLRAEAAEHEERSRRHWNALRRHGTPETDR